MFRNVFLAGRISTTGTSDDKTESSDPVDIEWGIFFLFLASSIFGERVLNG